MSDKRYLVAARKYRPKRFDEVVAQEHVTETLKNALRLDRLGHAYLFSGPRGVGKTTVARILAKAINCSTPLSERDDEAEPCQECDSCQSFEGGRSLNIFEMDAASNNSVDDIRELREKVRVPPQGGHKKVYIIDEVHMLSKSAFNAFLKTLEEPPPHALFIFATTEPHKVLATILSRCQRFDFRRIPVPTIAEHLRAISEAEGITADEASLLLLARKGNGALRDALSAFDQAVSLCGTDLRYDDLVEALGVVARDRFFDVTDHVLRRNNAALLLLADELVRAGYDMREFLTGLAEHLRNLMVARTTDDAGLIEATDAMRERYRTAAQDFEESELLRLLMIVADAEERIKMSTQPRLQFELALLKMAGLARAADLQETLERLDEIEANAGELDAGSAEADTPSTSGEPSSSYNAQPSTEQDTEEPGGPSSEKLKAASPESDAPSSESSAQEKPPSPEGPSSAENASPESSPASTSTSPTSKEQAPSEEQPSSTSEGDDLGLFNPPALRRSSSGQKNGGPHASANAAELSGSGGAAVTEAAPPQTKQLKRHWPEFVQAVKQVRVQVGAMLQDARPLGLRGDTAVVAVPKPFHKEVLRKNHSYLVNLLEEVSGTSIERFEVEVRITEAASDQTANTGPKDPRAVLEKKRENSPVVRAIFEQFGGELVW